MDVVEGLSALATLDGFAGYKRLRAGSGSEVDLSGQELGAYGLGVAVARLLKYSAATATVLDLRCAEP